ncbi:MAG: Rrf2 family transcriptional regulator [Armatimonadota bacterium]|nr:Rrf2 family transcriptional regulator [Armatimonadota bacterium]MDW8156973.1 Rrf2 family transcriptional regulator [Armatimonadota bacterium]
MRFTREAEYALRALSYLSSVPAGEVRAASQVAQACGLPGPFLSKTLRKLARSGLLRSARGRSRGYGLARNPREICVREVLEAVEGSDAFRRCVFWDAGCSDERPCVLHAAWAHVRAALLANLERMTLEDVRAAGWVREPPQRWMPASDSPTPQAKGGGS